MRVKSRLTWLAVVLLFSVLWFEFFFLSIFLWPKIDLHWICMRACICVYVEVQSIQNIRKTWKNLECKRKWKAMRGFHPRQTTKESRLLSTRLIVTLMCWTNGLSLDKLNAFSNFFSLLLQRRSINLDFIEICIHWVYIHCFVFVYVFLCNEWNEYKNLHSFDYFILRLMLCAASGKKSSHTHVRTYIQNKGDNLLKNERFSISMCCK